jgi:1-aminocyclopropane-1-carboxylate deaminase/D-cysteine desulfhydrase-like pyridoxal-dependent ACC family enzyme
VKNFISEAINQRWVEPNFNHRHWEFNNDYHFGGFGKTTSELVFFLNDFFRETGIPLDPVYTGKMMFGLIDMAKKGVFPKGSEILALHTGGLQGIKGMNEKLANKKLRIEYEEIISDPAFHSGGFTITE